MVPNILKSNSRTNNVHDLKMFADIHYGFRNLFAGIDCMWYVGHSVEWKMCLKVHCVVFRRMCCQKCRIH